jgi:hypothetical protein
LFARKFDLKTRNHNTRNATALANAPHRIQLNQPLKTFVDTSMNIACKSLAVSLALLPLTAHAHNTEGIGVALLALAGWPIVVVLCTVFAANGFRILTFLLSAAAFPASILFANALAQN